MKHLALLCLVILVATGCVHNETISGLMIEQKQLKDSLTNISGRIGDYIQKGDYDSAQLQKKQLEAVYTRLAAIQYSIDSRTKK